MKKMLTIPLSGRIDSGNAADAEKMIEGKLAESCADSVVIDASELAYISSAGLRILLRLKKKCPGMKITGVNPEVYEILDMTGFTEIMTVEKAYRVVSIEGCEEIALWKSELTELLGMYDSLLF